MQDSQALASEVTASETAVAEALRLLAAQLASASTGAPTVACPSCGLLLTEDALHAHYPMFHGSQPHVQAPCPL